MGGFKPYRDFFKRVLDVVLSIVILIIFFPVIVISLILVFREDGWPVFFKQERITKGRRKFRLFKIRTMEKGAEERLEGDKRLLEKFLNNDFQLKIDEDPRILVIGKWIRRHRIDELFQLFNVIKGDMSIVGPRALVEAELKYYEKRYPYLKDMINEMLSVNAGITGYAQVKEVSNEYVDIVKRIEMNVYYVNHVGVWIDIVTLLKTMFTMIKGSNF